MNNKNNKTVKTIEPGTLWLERQMHPDQRVEASSGIDIRCDQIAYLKDRHPYLVIVNPDAAETQVITPPQVIHCKRSGWLILNYGAWICASAGEHAMIRYTTPLEQEGVNTEDGEDGEGDTDLQPPAEGLGTLKQQAYHTAISMLEIAIDNDWIKVAIAEGHELMQFAIYSEAENYDLSIVGYLATEQEVKKKERLKALRGRRGQTTAQTPSVQNN